MAKNPVSRDVFFFFIVLENGPSFLSAQTSTNYRILFCLFTLFMYLFAKITISSFKKQRNNVFKVLEDSVGDTSCNEHPILTDDITGKKDLFSSFILCCLQ